MTDLASPAAQLRTEWPARLRLDYARRGERTVIAHREHTGPLRVQRPFYPEGPEVCHTILLHPPGGIAGGDQLELALSAGGGAHAVLTTPGATKWYRSSGPRATQRIALRAEEGACLEWLPQEAIVFRGARASSALRVDLAPTAIFIGWDICCLGRVASGERFDAGELRQHIEIVRAGTPLWHERARLEAGGRLLTSSAGMAGCPVSGLLLAATPQASGELLATCRAVPVDSAARAGVSALPGVLAVRYLGHSAEAARHYFRALWQVLRPGLVRRAACTPRIWFT